MDELERNVVFARCDEREEPRHEFDGVDKARFVVVEDGEERHAIALVDEVVLEDLAHERKKLVTAHLLLVPQLVHDFAVQVLVIKLLEARDDAAVAREIQLEHDLEHARRRLLVDGRHCVVLRRLNGLADPRKGTALPHAGRDVARVEVVELGALPLRRPDAAFAVLVVLVHVVVQPGPEPRRDFGIRRSARIWRACRGEPGGCVCRERELGQRDGLGRPRRVGWLDLVQVRQAVRVNGLTEIALTKLDILNGFKELPICVAYDVEGKRITEMPASLTEYRNAKPIYEALQGWGDLPEYIWDKGYDAMPKTLKDYIAFIEHEVDCPVKIVSVGPQRHETIIR